VTLLWAAIDGRSSLDVWLLALPQCARFHVPLRSSSLNSAISADIIVIRLPEPLNPIKRGRRAQGKKIYGRRASERTRDGVTR
jgi:hypothetical protein